MNKMKFTASVNCPPIGELAIINLIKEIYPIEVEWGNETSLSIDGTNFDTSASISRYLARYALKFDLYGSSIMEKTEVDHWLSFSLGPLSCNQEIQNSIAYLERVLGPVTYLVGNKITIADFIVYSTLYNNTHFLNQCSKKECPINISRWMSLIQSQKAVSEVLRNLPDEAKPQSQKPTGRKEEGKFIDLPGAEMGKVVVRFPPEASGYLHIGHAKAALLNQYYQEAFKGKLIMRFDDTNPAKEKVDFEKVILEDLELLQIKPDIFTHTSNYFDLIIELCEKLIKEGKAYVDDTNPEQMKIEREQRQVSVNRNNCFNHNLKVWAEMKKGSEKGQKCCVRAKIDMNSANGCMRDPTIFRCKNEPHPRTGDKYKVYPTYDFACPIVDSIEGVTHCLRTMEYHDRDDQFYWFIDALQLRKPYIWEYSRLNMTNTVLSKRKLTWFVDEGYVDGWDDPRFPTVRGVLRRGMTVEGLKQFIIAQGSSRSVVVMEWDKIWSFNKKVIDPIAPRYTAVEKNSHVPVLVTAKEEPLKALKHPKNTTIGEKTVWVGPKLIIDREDANILKEGENTTFINWGNLKIKKVVRDGSNIKHIEADPNLADKDFKKTLKLTWLAETSQAPFIPCVCVYFDHIISKPILGKDEDFKTYIGKNTKTEVLMHGDPELKNVKKSDIIQIQRKGFFICDSPYIPPSIHTGKESPIILFSIPDGKDALPSSAPNKKSEAVKEKIQPTKSKSKEKSVEKENSPVNADAASINLLIQQQGDKVRQLKQEKVEKIRIDGEVKVLLHLKEQFKTLTGKDWKPGVVLESNINSGYQDSNKLSETILSQGNKVRQLKEIKAPKELISAEVKSLLELKKNFKDLTGNEWKPEGIKENNIDSDLINNKISLQGNKIRDLKTKKADKSIIATEVEILLQLKAEYKSLVGKEWKPSTVDSKPEPISKPEPVSAVQNSSDINQKIIDQGDKIRQLKSSKASKGVIDEEVKILLKLKDEFQSVTGESWKPNLNISAVKNTIMENKSNSVISADELTVQVNEQGNIVRQLKSSSASKENIDEAVKKLLALKLQYKELTGTDFPVAGRGSSVKKEKETKSANQKKGKSVKEKIQVVEDANDSSEISKKQTRLGIEAKKEENLPDWYSQVLTKGEMIEYYDVSGCYILRPWSYSIWENIQSWMDKQIKQLGVKNCNFPIFVSKGALEKEKTHVADFAPEVAWVTKSGDTDLAEHIAIRPTSETVMYPAYAKWIQSYRDLPLKLNQWNNVVRWEFKHPQPFLRTREFLWQEGHTAFATKAEADKEVLDILDLYARIYTELLAIPVIKGRKTEKEKFAGGDYTTTVEAFVSASGRAIQGATSHHLGQNFSKMFEITYEDPETQEKKHVFQNSWGITTRTIGVMIMIHADNKGLVLPPRVASIQVVIVPCGITVTLKEEEKLALMNACKELEDSLNKAEVRVYGDYRDNYSPGWKFNHWELKGVPVRVEIGPKDLKQNQFVAVRRDTGEKLTIKKSSGVTDLSNLLLQVHDNLLKKANEDLTSHTKITHDWKEFCHHLDNKNIILAPFCGNIPCEDKIKQDSARDESEPGSPAMGAKSLCIPFDQLEGIKSGTKCVHPECMEPAKIYTLFGRSY